MFYNRNFERLAKYFVKSVRACFDCKNETIVIENGHQSSAVTDARPTYSQGKF